MLRKTLFNNQGFIRGQCRWGVAHYEMEKLHLRRFFKIPKKLFIKSDEFYSSLLDFFEILKISWVRLGRRTCS